MEGRNFESQRASPQVDEMTRLKDMKVRAAFADPESKRVLYENNPVLWLRGAIGIRTERGASQVSDRELGERLLTYGRREWDPFVTRNVEIYLKSQGFFRSH